MIKKIKYCFNHNIKYKIFKKIWLFFSDEEILFQMIKKIKYCFNYKF